MRIAMSAIRSINIDFANLTPAIRASLDQDLLAHMHNADTLRPVIRHLLVCYDGSAIAWSPETMHTVLAHVLTWHLFWTLAHEHGTRLAGNADRPSQSGNNEPNAPATRKSPSPKAKREQRKGASSKTATKKLVVRPCVKCGKAPAVVTGGRQDLWWLTCEPCGLTSTIEETRKKAKRSWNKRQYVMDETSA